MYFFFRWRDTDGLLRCTFPRINSSSVVLDAWLSSSICTISSGLCASVRSWRIWFVSAKFISGDSTTTRYQAGRLAANWNARNIFSPLDVHRHSGTLAFPTRSHLSSSHRGLVGLRRTGNGRPSFTYVQIQQTCRLLPKEPESCDRKAQDTASRARARVGLDHMVAILFCVPGAPAARSFSLEAFHDY